MVDLVYEDGSVAMSDITSEFSDEGFVISTVVDKPYLLSKTEPSNNLVKVFLSENDNINPCAYVLKSVGYTENNLIREKAVVQYTYVRVA